MCTFTPFVAVFPYSQRIDGHPDTKLLKGSVRLAGHLEWHPCALLVGKKKHMLPLDSAGKSETCALGHDQA